MEAGIPLDDADRKDWLDSLGMELANAASARRPVVLTCSALKRRYRDMLRQAAPHLGFVFLDLSREAAAERVARRSGHFMPASLVDSQFADLEPPGAGEAAITLDAGQPVADIVARALAALGNHLAADSAQPH
jgi:gluconokinase